jgi:hypothetical protein
MLQLLTGGRRGASAGLQPTSQIKTLKNTDFVDTITSNVLRGLPSNRNKPLKLSDDKITGILKNKIKNLGLLK